MPGLTPSLPDAIGFARSCITKYGDTPYAGYIQEAIDSANKGDPEKLRGVLGNEMHRLEVDLQTQKDAQNLKDLEQLQNLRETFAFEFDDKVPKPDADAVKQTMAANAKNFSLFSNLRWSSILHPIASIKQLARNLEIKRDIRSGAI